VQLALACLASVVSIVALGGAGQRSLGVPSGVTVTNLRLAGSGAPADDLLLYWVNEEFQANTDVNGDGDDGDSVLHLQSLVDGGVVNLRLSAIPGAAAATRELLAFLVEERTQASTDLNADGDVSDTVLHVLDRVQKRLTSLEIAATPFSSRARLLASGRNVAFGVLEHDQGETDLNGDGDTNDFVVHVYRPADGVASLDLALSVFNTTGPPELMSLAGDLLAFLVGEDEQGVDLNGDGTLGDDVLHVYDFATGQARNLGFSLGQSDTSEHLWAANAELVVFGVSESAQGGVDLNGDGDAVDLVPHVLRGAAGTPRNLALASVGFPFQEGYVVGESFAAFQVSEIGQGDTVLNGDGDRDDVVAFVYDARSDAVRNLQLGVKRLALNQVPLWEAGRRQLAFQVSEPAERRDLNGDGDIGSDNERVLHVHDLDTSVTRNVGLAVVDGIASATQLAFRVPEALQGGQDLTGDGDTNDAVLHVHDFLAGVTHGSGAAAADNYTLATDVVLFTASEFFGQVDLNGDGDTGDDVGFVFAAASGVVHPLGLAVPRFGPFTLTGQLSPRRTALLFVSERDQGETDLNGDGDSISFDLVLHRIDVHEISRLR